MLDMEYAYVPDDRAVRWNRSGRQGEGGHDDALRPAECVPSAAGRGGPAPAGRCIQIHLNN